MSYFDIDPPPGIWRQGSENQSKGRWWNANLVRWYGALVGPIGGWRTRSANAVSGVARAIVAWKTNAAAPARWLGIGTHTGLYVQDSGGATTAITPAAFVAGVADETVNLGFGVGPMASTPTARRAGTPARSPRRPPGTSRCSAIAWWAAAPRTGGSWSGR
jgi:hypothetical protein